MAIIPEDNIDRDSTASLRVRLSKIANDTTHHSAAQAKKLHDEWKSDLPKAQLLAWRKRVKRFLEQNETTINRPF
jgi:hypothetical protein